MNINRRTDKVIRLLTRFYTSIGDKIIRNELMLPIGNFVMFLGFYVGFSSKIIRNNKAILKCCCYIL